ncbi:hypothetical protein DACRYDRAFT_89931 [Dacryopinax primogenitus]|uniref:Uncharacterized protein n=1 Tax=Dacryopinax primogenitus (strain DJM 731) TaxID=1858805 RepID=M5FXG6_DACPD|nr:uncharacterized protein DACRYDRAFT_89931 [Dacryopinax primogenitus]EJU00485.1 hypothetical protein DACRYDRAFT_89931 [Dacryopinax primogenitus]
MTHISIDAHDMVGVKAVEMAVVPASVPQVPVAPAQWYALALRHVGPRAELAEGASSWLRHRLDQDCFKYPFVRTPTTSEPLSS